MRVQALGDHGFPVPTAIDNNRHAVLMELVDAQPLVQVGGCERHPCLAFHSIAKASISKLEGRGHARSGESMQDDIRGARYECVFVDSVCILVGLLEEPRPLFDLQPDLIFATCSPACPISVVQVHHIRDYMCTLGIQSDC
jgi:hypothetical protein